MTLLSKGRFLGLAFWASLAAVPANATTVQPVLLDLSERGSAASRTFNVENTASAALPIEIVVEEIAFEDGNARTAGRSQDLLVFPAQAVIPPGGSQAFRVQWAGKSGLDSAKSYYVTVAQQPINLPEAQSAVQVLYNFQVLVNIAPAGARPDLRVESASIGQDAQGGQVPVIVISNNGAAQAYLSRGTLNLVQKDAQGRVLFQKSLTPSDLQQSVGFGLVPPGQRRSVMLPVSLPSGAGSLEARFLPSAR